MADLLTRCGTVLAEDVFSVIFGYAPTELDLYLLHTGIMWRDNMSGIYFDYTLIKDSDSTQVTAPPVWEFHQETQEIRIAQQAALQLLCTYFKGLDKIIPIIPSVPRAIPYGYSEFNYTSKSQSQHNTQFCLRFSNKIEFVGYPLPLVASFKGAIDNSTPCLRKLQYHLEQYKYLGAENVIFTPDSIMIDLNAAFSKEQFAVFKYFTGMSFVSDFKNWVKSFINESSNDTFVELLQNIDRESTIEEIIFEVIVLCVMNRDLIYMGILPYECIQTIIKPMMSPRIKDSVFDKIHYAARLISCFEEVECIKKHIEQNVDELLHHMYSVIIPSDIPVLSFKRNYDN